MKEEFSSFKKEFKMISPVKVLGNFNYLYITIDKFQ